MTLHVAPPPFLNGICWRQWQRIQAGRVGARASRQKRRWNTIHSAVMDTGVIGRWTDRPEADGRTDLRRPFRQRRSHPVITSHLFIYWLSFHSLLHSLLAGHVLLCAGHVHHKFASCPSVRPSVRLWLEFVMCSTAVQCKVLILQLHCVSPASSVTVHYTLMWHHVPAAFIPTSYTCNIMLHYVTLHYVTLHNVTLVYVTLHYVTLHYVTLRYVRLHYVMLYHVILYCFTLRYITLHYITLHLALLPKATQVNHSIWH